MKVSNTALTLFVLTLSILLLQQCVLAQEASTEIGLDAPVLADPMREEIDLLNATSTMDTMPEDPTTLSKKPSAGIVDGIGSNLRGRAGMPTSGGSSGQDSGPHISITSDSFGDDMDGGSNPQDVDGSTNGSDNTPSLMRWPYRHFRNKRHYGYAIDLHNYNTHNFNSINAISYKRDVTAQLWYLGVDGRIRAYNDRNKCLEAGKEGKLYQRAFLYDCHDGRWQRWYMTSSGRIKNRHHGKYLGISWCGEYLNQGLIQIELRDYEFGSCGLAQKWWYT